MSHGTSADVTLGCDVDIDGEVAAHPPYQPTPAKNAGFHHRRAGVSGHRTECREAEPLGQLAREGHEVVQFKDVNTNRFVAVVVDGKITVYGAEHGARKQ